MTSTHNLTGTANNPRAIIGLLLGCVLFGLGSLIVAFMPIGTFAIAFWRMFIAFFVFTWLMLWRRTGFPQNRKALFFAALGGFFFAFDLSFWHESIHAVGPGISTLLNSLQIFFVTAIGFFFFQERFGVMKLASLMLAIAGVALIASPEFHHNHNAMWGFASGILSAAMFALAMACVRKVHDYEPVALTSLMTIFNLSGALILLPIALFANAPFLPTSVTVSFWVLVYGLVMQCGAWALVVHAIARIALSVTGLLLLSEPVAAIVIDALLLGKAITPLQWLGCAITLMAIYLGTLRR